MDQALPNALGAVTADSARQRVLDAMDDRAPDLAAALGRAVPFLMRKNVPIAFEGARFVTPGELDAKIGEHADTLPLATDPGGSRALLCFEASANALFLNGSLGGSIEDDEKGGPLTSTQRAVIGKIADAIVRKLSDVLGLSGLTLKRLPPRAQIAADTPLAAIVMTVGKDKPKRVVFALAREALQILATGQQSSAQRRASARVPAVLAQAEVTLSVELGRIQKRLAAVEALRVGDILRLDTSVQAPVVVRVENQHVMFARPTSRGTQLAITICDAPAALPPAIQVRAVTVEGSRAPSVPPPTF